MLEFIIGFCLGYWVHSNKDVVKGWYEKIKEWLSKDVKK